MSDFVTDLAVGNFLLSSVATIIRRSHCSMLSLPLGLKKIIKFTYIKLLSIVDQQKPK